LPYYIEYLKNLRTLNVSYNQLTDLPYYIEYLKNLHRLEINGNRLTSLPSSLERFTSQPERNFPANNQFSRSTQRVENNRFSRFPQRAENNRFSSFPRRFSQRAEHDQFSHFSQRTENNRSDADIEQAEQLLQNGQDRAAGTIAGVALEAYIKNLCTQHNITHPERARLQSLIQSLEDEDAITAERASHMMRLASIRNKCAHPGPVEKHEVSLLVREVRKLLDPDFSGNWRTSRYRW
jgi:Leucine-rich repeat (LRR) protein